MSVNSFHFTGGGSAMPMSIVPGSPFNAWQNQRSLPILSMYYITDKYNELGHGGSTTGVCTARGPFHGATDVLGTQREPLAVVAADTQLHQDLSPNTVHLLRCDGGHILEKQVLRLEFILAHMPIQYESLHYHQS
jgi:hypothetical protein